MAKVLCMPEKAPAANERGKIDAGTHKKKQKENSELRSVRTMNGNFVANTLARTERAGIVEVRGAEQKLVAGNEIAKCLCSQAAIHNTN